MFTLQTKHKVKNTAMEQEFEFFADSEFAIEDLQDEGSERVLMVRLDKWLWAARFFKTRALARVAVEAGKVFYNGERSKPSREIEIGAILQIRQGRYEKTVIIKGLSTRRRSTDEALQLFEETEESKLAREQQAIDWPPQQHYQQPYQQNEFSYSPYPEQRERRVVRFLRRSFPRQGEAPRNDRAPVYPQSQYIRPEEFANSEIETFE